MCSFKSPEMDELDLWAGVIYEVNKGNCIMIFTVLNNAVENGAMRRYFEHFNAPDGGPKSLRNVICCHLEWER